ncbi:hypothetical protein DPMN_069027 [Dreissena polymorpha]|uniref:Uncharacterized protein n=1 Tax=Dreissena polymorpha TaxID=45954 RepID=A0A9D4BWY0_DREPO|nr:hypothetical protein DPMN_069027 [Dreissena polymorpha]
MVAYSNFRIFLEHSFEVGLHFRFQSSDSSETGSYHSIEYALCIDLYDDVVENNSASGKKPEGEVKEAGRLHSSPFLFKKKLLGDKRSCTLDYPRQEVEEHLRNVHSEENREHFLSTPTRLCLRKHQHMSSTPPNKSYRKCETSSERIEQDLHRVRTESRTKKGLYSDCWLFPEACFIPKEEDFKTLKQRESQSSDTRLEANTGWEWVTDKAVNPDSDTTTSWGQLHLAGIVAGQQTKRTSHLLVEQHLRAEDTNGGTTKSFDHQKVSLFLHGRSEEAAAISTRRRHRHSTSRRATSVKSNVEASACGTDNHTREKKGKYQPIIDEFRRQGWKTWNLPVEVGNRGFALQSILKVYGVLGIT